MALFIRLGCLNVKCLFLLVPAMVVAITAHCDTVYQKETNSHFDVAALRPTLKMSLGCVAVVQLRECHFGNTFLFLFPFFCVISRYGV